MFVSFCLETEQKQINEAVGVEKKVKHWPDNDKKKAANIFFY